ncbi:hypothetical protein L3X38_033473 [Prunus dulcis]|uniref:RNase H type-1 domain-containing protein n=1 Tax=Prunus dulcis TaxID=3755 RepID=A0AAD4YWX4_PRUDU|nr:hypothetical protein L3X38_033473 [Prunus dulcis]
MPGFDRLRPIRSVSFSNMSFFVSLRSCRNWLIENLSSGYSGSMILGLSTKLTSDLSILGLLQMTVNSDSAVVVDMINGEWVDSHPMSVLLTKCRELLKSQWNCSSLHVYRETNFAADFLAKMGHHKGLGYHELSSPPDLMQPILDDDKSGLLRPRFVYV